MKRRNALLRIAVGLGSLLFATCRLIAGIWVYSGPKTLAAHLTEDHGIPVSQVAGRDHNALVQIHSAVHEGRYNPAEYILSRRRPPELPPSQNENTFTSMTTYNPDAPQQTARPAPEAYTPRFAPSPHVEPWDLDESDEGWVPPPPWLSQGRSSAPPATQRVYRQPAPPPRYYRPPSGCPTCPR